MTETIKAVPVIDGIDFDEYCDTLIQRYRNHKIKDHISRLATDSLPRIQGFVLPVLTDHLRNNRVVKDIYMVIGSWIFFLKSLDVHKGTDHKLVTLQKGMLSQELIDLANNIRTPEDVKNFLSVAGMIGDSILGSDIVVKRIFDAFQFMVDHSHEADFLDQWEEKV